MTVKNMLYYLRREGRCCRKLRILGAWHDPRSVGVGHRGARHADLDAAHEGRASRAISTARSPFAALAPAAGRNARLIGIVFFDVPCARKPQGLHQISGAGALFERRPGEEEAVGVYLVDLRQAEEGEMDLRQRLFARAPSFAGAADFFDDAPARGWR
jgi:hypothetical protein